MEDKRQIIDAINDLVRINRDRTDGYRKAADELGPTDLDLKSMFTSMANTSLQYGNTLSTEIRKLGGLPASDSTTAGKLYRVWMDIRSTVGARDRKSVLALCEFGEEAALRAYDTVIQRRKNIPAATNMIIEEQRANIQSSCDMIKRYRAMHQAVS